MVDMWVGVEQEKNEKLTWGSAARALNSFGTFDTLGSR
jgi:hypothetical protein